MEKTSGAKAPPTHLDLGNRVGAIAAPGKHSSALPRLPSTHVNEDVARHTQSVPILKHLPHDNIVRQLRHALKKPLILNWHAFLCCYRVLGILDRPPWKKLFLFVHTSCDSGRVQGGVVWYQTFIPQSLEVHGNPWLE